MGQDSLPIEAAQRLHFMEGPCFVSSSSGRRLGCSCLVATVENDARHAGTRVSVQIHCFEFRGAQTQDRTCWLTWQVYAFLFSFSIKVLIYHVVMVDLSLICKELPCCVPQWLSTVGSYLTT